MISESPVVQISLSSILWSERSIVNFVLKTEQNVTNILYFSCLILFRATKAKKQLSESDVLMTKSRRAATNHDSTDIVKNPLLGAYNSHNPMQRHFYRPEGLFLDIFPAK